MKSFIALFIDNECHNKVRDFAVNGILSISDGDLNEFYNLGHNKFSVVSLLKHIAS